MSKNNLFNQTALFALSVGNNVNGLSKEEYQKLKEILTEIQEGIKELQNNSHSDQAELAKNLLETYKLKSAENLLTIIPDTTIPEKQLYLSTLASECDYVEAKDGKLVQKFLPNERKEGELHQEKENIDQFIQDFIQNGFAGKGKKIAFIEGSPGSGKTMFSQKFAFENVLKYFDKDNTVNFLPIYIRLRDWTTEYLTKPEELLYKCFFSFIPTGLSPNKKRLYQESITYLTDENLLWDKKLLFIFDGLDELELQGTQNSPNFINLISEFLNFYNNENQNQNFLAIITGRPFQNTINLELSKNLNWFYLDGFKKYQNEKTDLVDKKMDWAKRWDKLNSIDIEANNSFQNFISKLQENDVYKQNQGIQNVFSEPFVLFNTAKLVLDNKLQIKDLQANADYVRVLIYEKIIFETIQKSREADQNNDLFEGRIDLKYEFIQKLATGIFNIDGEKTKIGVIKKRISKGKNSLEEILNKIVKPKEINEIENNDNLNEGEKEQKIREVYNQNFTKIKDDNLLSFFYFKHNPNPDDFWDSNIEFAHKSFGEFLQAREVWQTLFDLKKIIKNYDQQNNNHLKSYNLENLTWKETLKHTELLEIVYQTIYNLLSGRAMTEQTIVYDFWRQMLEVAIEDVKEQGGFFIKKEDLEKIESKPNLNLKNNYPNNINQFYSQFLTANYQFIFQALESFYRKWSKRGFINELPTKNLIAEYQENLNQFYKDQELESLQTLRVDITAGVNVLLILLRINCERELNRSFLKIDDFDEEREIKNKLARAEEYSYPLVKLSQYKLEIQNFLKKPIFRKLQKLSILELGEDSDFKQNWQYLEGVELGYNRQYLGKYLYFANLRSVDLTGVDLIGANLTGADLRDANLKDVNLKDADLTGADLRDANLRDADLKGADLIGADLIGADLKGADLRDANLICTDLRGANLRGANLWNVNLSGTKI